MSSVGDKAKFFEGKNIPPGGGIPPNKKKPEKQHVTAKAHEALTPLKNVMSKSDKMIFSLLKGKEQTYETVTEALSALEKMNDNKNRVIQESIRKLNTLKNELFKHTTENISKTLSKEEINHRKVQSLIHLAQSFTHEERSADGIFRESPSLLERDKVIKKLENGEEVVGKAMDKFCAEGQKPMGVCKASVLRRGIQTLDQPLFPIDSSKIVNFAEMSKENQANTRAALRKEINGIPANERELLKSTIEVMNKIYLDNEKYHQSRMTSTNLGTLLGPNIFPALTDIAEIATRSSYENQLAEFMIVNYEGIFAEDDIDGMLADLYSKEIPTDADKQNFIRLYNQADETLHEEWQEQFDYVNSLEF